jgi:CRISPR-associated protein Csb2
MPFVEGKNQKTTKIFDTFIQLMPETPLQVAWDITLQPEQLAALEVLAQRLGYLGRAESLVEAKISNEFRDDELVVCPLRNEQEIPVGKEVVRLLTPVPPEEYKRWRADFDAKALATLGLKPKNADLKKLQRVPTDLFAALHADSGELQAAGWSLPPGTQYINYARSQRAFIPALCFRQRQNVFFNTVARYAVVSTVPPRITQAISVCDRVHKSLCSLSEKSIVFTGKYEDGELCTDHEHAHIFCEANGTRDTITHLTVWAKMGFDEMASTALRQLNRVWGHGGHDLRLVLLGLGQPSDFPDSPLFYKSKVWRSLTPFVSTRHSKAFRDGRPKIDENGWQIGSAGHDLLRLLSLSSVAANCKISQQRNVSAGGRDLRSLEFQTTRDGGGRRGSGDCGGFTITFQEDVVGPLAFGYGAHFGLGLFVPAKVATDGGYGT